MKGAENFDLDLEGVLPCRMYSSVVEGSLSQKVLSERSLEVAGSVKKPFPLRDGRRVMTGKRLPLFTSYHTKLCCIRNVSQFRC